jgi:transaldolase
VGRLDDIGENGMRLVKEIVAAYKNYPDSIKTQVLAASIRHPQHCIEAAQAGAQIASVPYQVLMQMIQHPLTDIGIRRFLEDWHKVMGTSAEGAKR